MNMKIQYLYQERMHPKFLDGNTHSADNIVVNGLETILNECLRVGGNEVFKISI